MNKTGFPQLPPSQLYQTVASHENGWSDQYGSLAQAARYAGCTLPPRHWLRAVWQHGCNPPWYDYSPDLLCNNTPNARELLGLVARKEQAALLQANGYKHVRAIGLPILYAPASPLPRAPGSLLVVPTHTLLGEGCTDRAPFERYADEIVSQIPHFQKVVVCIHPSCRVNGLWVKEFEARGIEIVFGAQPTDTNALTRMRMLFAQFETMTTNGWGSHIAYGLAAGIRVSVWGTKPKREVAAYMRDSAWAADPAALEKFLSTETAAKEKAFLEPYWGEPRAAVANVELGRWLIGADNQISPEDMRQLLPEMIDPPPLVSREDRGTTSVKPVRRKRILFVSHEATRTGAPMALLHLLRWLRQENRVDFEILLGAVGPLASEFQKIGAVHLRSDLQADPEAWRRFDLIYANTCLNGELLDELPVGDIPIISHVHELGTTYDLLGARRVAACLRQSEQIWAGSDAVAECLERRFGCSRREVFVMPKLIDGARMRRYSATELTACRRQHAIPEDARVVIGCGPQDFRKGVDLFLQMARQVKAQWSESCPLRFLWVGAPGKSDVGLLLKADIEHMGMQAEMALLGELADPQPLFALADVVCFPSREDAGPLALLEAAALGKPILGFAAAGGLAELTRHGGGITVPHLDVAALAEACTTLLRDEPRRSAMGEAARVWVGKNHELATWGARIMDRVEELLTAKRRLSARPSLAEVYARWSPDEAPQRPYVLAHLARSRVRLEAAGLIKGGRLKEAMGTLVRALNADLATNNPLIICESLCEIGQDIEPLDAKQAAVLYDRAAVVARGAQFPIERFRSRASVTRAAPAKSLLMAS